jgi:hypothetical protein
LVDPEKSKAESTLVTVILLLAFEVRPMKNDIHSVTEFCKQKMFNSIHVTFRPTMFDQAHCTSDMSRHFSI